MKKINELSVVLPAFNEEKILAVTFYNVKKNLKKIADKYQIIIINDGSKDKTGQIADRLASENNSVNVIHHSSNLGYGAAIKSGIYSARYLWIVIFDSDGQFDFTEIKKFFKKQRETNADIVWGYVLDRKVSIFRKINTFLWNGIILLIFKLKIKWIDCGYRLFKKEIVHNISKLESERGAFINSEFLIKAKKNGFKIEEVEINHYPDKARGSTGSDFNVIIKSFTDLFRLRKKLVFKKEFFI